MVESPLKPIKFLKCSSDLRNFSQFRQLADEKFFETFWHSILELLVVNKSYHTAFEVFIDTIYFFSESQSLEFEKKHQETISEFTFALNKQESEAIEKVLGSQGFFELFENISKFVQTSPDSLIEPLKDLLESVRIIVIEKSDEYEDSVWEVKNSRFSVVLFEKDSKAYHLFPKQKLTIPAFNVPDTVLAFGQDTFLDTEDESSILEVDNYNNDEFLKILDDESENNDETSKPGTLAKTDKKYVRFFDRKEEKSLLIEKNSSKDIKSPLIIVEEKKTIENPQNEEYYYQEASADNNLEPPSFCGANLCQVC